MWDCVHTEERDGFTIKLEFGPEHISPRDSFDVDDVDSIIEDIESGRLMWFTARVAVQKAGVTLGDDYLGACCYASVQDFIEGGYYEDMITCAMEAAHDALARLAA